MEMFVYKTHRSASYPDYVYQSIKDNMQSSSLMKFGAGVESARISSPFSIPQNGLEVLWNHTLRFRGQSISFEASTVNVNAAGSRSVTLRDYQYYFGYSDPELTTADLNNKIFFLKRKTLAPASQAGGITLVHETLDQVRSPRKSWIYVPGQRHIRRTPSLNHDIPDIPTNSLRTIDQVDMFNGAPTYYDWKLVGLQHRYAKRRYYFDEDSWSIVYAEEYDEDGSLWQFTEAHLINYFDVPLVFSTLENTYDFKDNRYFVEGIDNERGATWDYSVEYSLRDFTTSAIRREAKR
jgi:hypothetical protein